MVEQSSKRQHEVAAPAGRRWFALGLIAAAHVALAAICSPAGVRSGDWAVPGLPDPDLLVFVAAGATLIHPMILYSLWAGMGPGAFLRRFVVTSLLCVAHISAVFARAHLRGMDVAMQVIDGMLVCAFFVLMVVVFRWIRRRWSWRIDLFDALTIAPQPLRFQFRLRHALEGITLAACLLALYRFHFPHGLPSQVMTDLWREMVRSAVGAPLTMLVLAPTVIVPWMALACGTGRNIAAIAVIAVVICWGAVDCGLAWLGTALGSPLGDGNLWIQLGASAAGLMSALALRFCGYRINRVTEGAGHRGLESPAAAQSPVARP